MLSASIKVNSAEISFKTPSLPDAASGKPKEKDVILPLLFEQSCKLIFKICQRM
jgi:hypothetical protein